MHTDAESNTAMSAGFKVYIAYHDGEGTGE